MTARRRVLPMGDRALLVELPDLPHALALYDAVRRAQLTGVLEAVPAARTVLVRFDPAATTADDLTAALTALPAPPGRLPDGRLVTIGVRYDGPDLAEVAALLGVDERQVVEWHTAGSYRVAFGGFAPGFAYLTDGHPALDVPRRSEPRTRVPAGSVALAGSFSAVYPRDSPGGWQLLGRTDLPLWDANRDPPALLRPGDRVRFVDLEEKAGEAVETAGLAGGTPNAPTTTPADVRRGPTDPEHAVALDIIDPGLQATLQDEGRPGLASIGVPASGALDRHALHAANRLVGNRPDEAVIEFAGRAIVRAAGELVLAVTGVRAAVTVLEPDGRTGSVGDCRPLALAAGAHLLVEPTSGLRTYLAVRGGFDMPAVLGCRSTDVLSGIGPSPLRAGSRLSVRSSAVEPVGDPQPWPARPSRSTQLPVLPGPRADWFTASGMAAFFDTEWTVTPQSNRVGLRLTGAEPLERAITTELPSEGMVKGAIQVPPDGPPVLFLADHPVTGGYPVIAVVHSSALDLAGQLAPGARVRFVRAG